MVDPQIRSLRVLAGIRRRRGAELEKALAAQRAELTRCAEESQAARQGLAECEEALSQAAVRRSQLYDAAFTPEGVRAADHAMDVGAVHKAEAEKLLKRCESSEQWQQRQVVAAQAAVRANAERIERFDVRIARALSEKLQAEDEAADEEAEEMASARIGRRNSAPGEAGDHA